MTTEPHIVAVRDSHSWTPESSLLAALTLPWDTPGPPALAKMVFRNRIIRVTMKCDRILSLH